jgi:hypothetical protein
MSDWEEWIWCIDDMKALQEYMKWLEEMRELVKLANVASGQSESETASRSRCVGYILLIS